MRREGRQHGWVRAYDRALSDPEGKRRAAQPVEGQTPNGGFVRVPRKPTNRSKFSGGGAYGKINGKEAEPSYSKGSLKFKHDKLKMAYLEAADALDGGLDLFGLDA